MHMSSPENKRVPSREWEQLQLKRLILSLVLFLTVVLGRRFYPENIVAAGERVVGVLSQSTDIEAVFAQLGEAMTGEEGMLEGLENFCVEVFGAQQNKIAQPENAAILQPMLPVAYSGLLENELKKIEVQKDQERDGNDLAVNEKVEDVAPPVGTVLTAGGEAAQNYPAGYTGDELCFGELQTVAPVIGELNSGFGYRDHPINGTYSFHGGADINANAGDAIRAFACGEVEYVGEDDSYGLYLQLDHGNGIKSFYAHCQSVYVKKGDRVEIGQTVAAVGSTGRATGPHLHLELKCCGVRVNPAYYVEFL